MPDAAGNFKGITVPAKAWERIFSNLVGCEWHPEVEATHEISGCPACEDCWEKAYNLD